MIFFVLFCIFVLTLLYSLYIDHRNVKRITDQGVFYLGSFIGNMLRAMWRGEHMSQNVIHRYNKVKEAQQKFGVELEFGNPSYFVTDLELIKLITIKHFDHFVNPRKLAASKKSKDMMGRMLIALEGSEWRAVRSKISPTLTTGKIKRMFHIMDSSGKKLVTYLRNQMEKQNDEVNLEDGFSKFTMDFISSAAFGLDTKAFDNKEPSVFEKMSTKIQFRLSLGLIVKFVMVTLVPRIADFLGLSLFDGEAQEFFQNVIRNAIKVRDENPEVKRNDFLELLLESRDGGQVKEAEQDAEAKNTKVSLDEVDIAAQSVVFIAAGLDTVRSALQLAAYQLALHPDVQERLYQELHKAVEDNDGELSYEMINELEYLDQVINESLRVLPITPGTMRTCTKAFTIPGTTTVIPQGAVILLPIFAIHRDPAYFPNPEKFDPERFSAQNRSKIVPGSYMPFGQGPRQCIAIRLALVEVKAAIARIILNFVLEPSDKTQIPLKFSANVNLQAEGGVWLKLQSRF